MPAWTPTGGMIESRAGHTATLLPDGTVLVAGGSSGGSDNFALLASAELYDPASGSWTATGNMVTPRISHRATLLPDGTVLVAGGYGGGGGLESLTSAELYDPTSGSWTATAGMIEARAGHTATLLPDGTVLVAGGAGGRLGSDSFAPLASAELYDASSGSWTATANMDGVRVHHTATLLPNDTVLVAGGADGGRELASAELYDPSSGSWTATGEMIEARSSHRATRLLDGMVLVEDSFPLASTELYDPGSGHWTATGNMGGVRFNHTSTLLPDGMVLVAGGNNNSGLLASAELYDPNGGTWTATAVMIEARAGHTATGLPDGVVLVAGGYLLDSGGSRLASAELYHPGNGT